MPWAYIQTVADGGSWDDYLRVAEEVGEGAPPGLIVHVAGPFEGGFRIIDVWESQSDYDSFLEQRLMPAFERALGPTRAAENPPPLETLDVQHIVVR
jgi:hypothetical protein